MKYLAVDLGNVILKVDFVSFKKSLSKTLDISMEEAEYFLNRTQQLHDSGLTNISDELKDLFKIKSTVIMDDLMEEWNSTIAPDKFMIDTLDSLIHPVDGTEPVKVALLSNIGFEHAKLMPGILTERVLNSTIRFFSCEVGARKPSLLYYKTFLDLYPEFKNCIYLDDRLENVEASRKLGLNGIQFILDKFSSPEELATEVAKIKKLIY